MNTSKAQIVEFAGELPREYQPARRPFVRLKIKKGSRAKPVMSEADLVNAKLVAFCLFVVFALAVPTAFAIYLLWEKISSL